MSVPPEDRAKEIKSLDMLPIEKTPDVRWCIESDAFKFRIELKDKPCICRGVLVTLLFLLCMVKGRLTGLSLCLGTYGESRGSDITNSSEDFGIVNRTVSFPSLI